jgi:hypothetical protein
MKNALIDPNSQIEYVSGWLGPGKPIFSILPDSARVAEVANAEFPVGLPLFWTPCADDVVADFVYAGTKLSVYHAKKGNGLPFHQHEFNHATMCHVGSCLVRVKGKEIVLTANSQPIDLPANIPHEIEALEDGTVFVNVFAEGRY